MFEEFDHFFQEGYPTELSKRQQTIDRMNNAGTKTKIKEIVRKCMNGSSLQMNEFEDDLGKLYGEKNKKFNMSDYKIAYDYVKKVFDKLIDSRSGSQSFRAAKKELFDLCGVKDPESRVIVINSGYLKIFQQDPYYSKRIRFEIIRGRQVSRFTKKSKTRFLHFSNNNINDLDPQRVSREFNNHCYIYPTGRCYFWAIDEDKINPSFIHYATDTYGKKIYEYKPTNSNNIFIDTAEYKRRDSCAVFINSDDALRVSDVTDEIMNLSKNNKGVEIHKPIVDRDDDDYYVNNKYKQIESELMRQFKSRVVMKTNASKPEKYKIILEKLIDDLQYDIQFIDDEKAELSNKYPKTKKLYLFDDLKKTYKKKVNALIKEIEGLIKKHPVVQESTLPTKERNKLDDSDFGIPETRSYPLHDKSHVVAAVRMFPNVPLKYRKELAKRILQKAHEFKMDTSGWGSINKYTNME